MLGSPKTPLGHAATKSLTYCEFARSNKRHMTNYESNVSTTWPVKLVEAAFQVKLPDKLYALETYVLCFLAKEKEVALAERAFTACLEAMVYQGGFCVKDAGQCSSASFPKLSESAKKMQYDALADWRIKNTPFVSDLAKESAEMEELTKRADLAAKIERSARDGPLTFQEIKDRILDVSADIKELLVRLEQPPSAEQDRDTM